jgi:predicted nucleic acid-binding Zn ribbon protein
VDRLAKEKSGLKEHPRPPKDTGKAGKLLQHRHCQVCSKAIPMSEEFCSEGCKAEFEAMVKKRKNYIYIIYGTMILIIAVMFLSYFL